jgi:aromatic-L-amino-acid/L-tryptophan decarboxylase
MSGRMTSDNDLASRDMDPEEFRREAHRVVDWLADYLGHAERYPVLALVQPGDIRRQLPPSAPADGEPFERIFADFERVIVPGLTHWNHPGFFAYFAITASGPGILAEMLAAGLNVQAMLWRTSPAATELEEIALGWLRDMMGLPATFEGVIYDTASVSTLHALAAARDLACPGVREHGVTRETAGLARIYCTEHTHSSIDKAVITLGFGLDAIRRIIVDDRFAMRPDALARAIDDDRAKGRIPVAAIATVGTTSSTAIDPVAALARVCSERGVWLHVDAAYAGVLAIVPAWRHILDGAADADSLVVNPHKWLFTPFDLSAFYCRRMDVLRAAFALVPEYLRTTEAGAVRNLMDTGIQLGRRFRALKLWMVLRYFGTNGLAARLEGHVRLAQLFASWVDAEGSFERAADVPFSVVCFRYHPAHVTDDGMLDRLNERLLDAVNRSGEVFLSHTKLRGQFVLRLAIGNLRTTERHVERAWDLLKKHAAALQ